MVNVNIINKQAIKDISNNRDNIINSTDIIKLKIDYYIKKSNEILNKLSIISIDNDIINKKKNYYKFEKEYKKNVEMIEYLINPDSKDYKELKDTKIEGLLDILKHNYYQIQNIRLSIKSDIVLKDLEKHEEKLTKSEDKLDRLETRFEGIGGTVISIVLSISIVSAAVSAIGDMPTKYVPLFIVSMVWMGMTFILFVNGLFGKENKNNNKVIALYCLITFVWITILAVTSKYFN